MDGIYKNGRNLQKIDGISETLLENSEKYSLMMIDIYAVWYARIVGMYDIRYACTK